MKHNIKIILAVIGGIFVVAGLFWSAMSIIANHGIKHLYDRKVEF